VGQLSGISGRNVRRIAERNGWVYQRNNGDHMVLTKPGSHQNLSVPDHRELDPGIVRALISILGMSVDEFLAALKD
jgi:predicted RNA binding protein YcfA (HicA-like mRNA interferase family)